ncbi:MAG TPA: C40 family peptidase [Vicinamibacterales bacterium]|nr:C40 family peptidase [Vicinamibacterales bacterium]
MSRPRQSALLSLIALAAASAACVSAGTPGPSPFPNAPRPVARSTDAGSAAALIATALQFRGVPYRLGGDEPRRGFDCSGFVHYVFEQHHVTLPRTVAEQYEVGAKVSLSRLEPGDLVFFATTASNATHVGLAIGPDQFIHAPGTGGVIRIDRVDAPYWKARALGARRVY